MPKPAVIPLSVPHMAGHEVRYLKECIDSNWVSYVGPFVSRFEETVAAYVGTPHAVATNSGTAALHIALLVAGLQPGEEVLVPDLTFIAPANAVRYCGAVPVFMDVEPVYWQLDAQKVADFLSSECRKKNGKVINKRSGRRVKAILPVHLLGHPCDMDRILEIARAYRLRVIEDCAQSLGTRYKGRHVGSLGDVGCFSFNGNKIITTGGGGMITTRNAGWAERAKYLTTQARDSAKEYIHKTIGYNYRLTNIQAAVGVAQMERLDGYIQMKQRIARRYEEGLRPVAGLTLPRKAPWAVSNHWLYTVVIDKDRSGRASRRLQEALERRGVQARALWAPTHEQKPYRFCQAYRIETAKRLYDAALSLPSSIGLSEKDQKRVIALVTEWANSSLGKS